MNRLSNEIIVPTKARLYTSFIDLKCYCKVLLKKSTTDAKK